MPGKRDSPGLSEIEVTPEMIEAGASVLCGFETYSTGEASWAEEVSRAMVTAALRARSNQAADSN